MTTIRDIAKVAGVSKSTVSNVLNGHVGTYSETTRQKVLQAVRSLNYRPNAVARSLASNQTLTMGVLMSDIGREPYARALHVVESILARRGYNVLIVNTHNDTERERQAIGHLLEHRIDGVLFISFSGVRENDHLTQLIRSQVPLVVLNRAVADHEMDAVRIDNTQGVIDAVAHLAELGHTKIGSIHLPLEGESMTLAATERILGFRMGMERCGLTLTEAWIREAELGEVHGLRSGYEATCDLLTQHPEVSALVCSNDYLAIGSIRAAWRLGRRVPNDLAVVGHDDTVAGRYHVPAITTIAQPMSEAARVATERLLDRIAGRTDDVPLNVTYGGRLIIRNSTDLTAPDLLLGQTLPNANITYPNSALAQ